ncbi:MAG: glycerol-3-phosphate 1-O-acyltransferase PlsY [Oligosphaeraceae bacterium]
MHLLFSLLAVAFWSYLLGSIPNGYLIGRFNGLDIRQHGSHNIGATNVRRILGRDWAILCFSLDFLKGFLPVVLIGHGLGAHWACGYALGGITAAAAAVCGHVFPFWLHFKGGKGVATTLGVVAGLALIPFLAGLVAWAILFYSCRRIVSVASIGAVIVMAIAATAMWATHYGNIPLLTALLVDALAALVVIRHKENIIRLIQGKENSFVKIKKK